MIEELVEKVETADIDVRKLTANWAELATFVHVRNKLDYKLFKDTFAQTFEVLKRCRTEAAVEKKYMKLILSAFKFIGTEYVSEDDSPKAAFVLTERMLNYCVVSKGEAADVGEDTAGIYLMDSYKEFFLNFNDVDGAIEALNRVYNKAYWNAQK